MADALLVSSSFLPGRGGIESYLAELADALAPRVAVAAAESRDGLRLSEMDLAYRTHGAPNKMLFPGRAALRHVIAAARREGTGKVLFGTPWPLVLLGPKLAAEGLRYAVIVHGAEMTVPAALPFVKSRLARALAGADLLLPVSGFTAERLADFLRRAGQPVPEIDLLRARVDLERFSPDADGAAARRRLGIAENEKVILCFGRLVKRKGVDRLIKVLPRIARDHPGTVVLVAGTGPELKRLQRLALKRLQRLARELPGAPRQNTPGESPGAPEPGAATFDVPEPGAATFGAPEPGAATPGAPGRVVFAGRVPDPEAPEVYAAADVFALPVVDRWGGLEMEGLGVVLLEAAACGVPNVTGRSGGTPEAVIDGTTGFVVDAHDDSALAAALTALLDEPERARSMGLAGREHVRENFSTTLPKSLIDWLDEGLR